jgi:hypothetical protein
MKTLGNPPLGIQVSGSRCAVRRRVCSRTTVLGGKGPLRRGKHRRALASCAPLCLGSFATDGSAGNPIQSSFFVLRKTRTR